MTAPMVDYKIHWLKMMSVPESRAVVGRHDGINGRDTWRFKVLSNEQREFYLENGYLIVENVLSAERLERARDALEERYALEGDQAGSEGTDHQHFVRCCHGNWLVSAAGGE